MLKYFQRSKMMNKRTMWSLSVLCLILCSIISVQAQESLRMAVVSDIHLKPAEQTAEARLLAVLADSLQRLRTDVLLVTGDMAHDGDEATHRRMAEWLGALHRSGMRVFVIPGNHDINNPNVRSLSTSDPTVSSVTPHQFEQIYAPFGPAMAVSRDTASLSYLAPLGSGLFLLALDGCIYDDGTYHSDGRLKPETLQWMQAAVRRITSTGGHVVAVLHHGVVDHFPLQNLLLPAYLIANHTEVQHELSSLGIRCVFTGHFHALDVARAGDLYDVETPTLSHYPCAFRLVEYDAQKQILTGSTHYPEVRPGYQEELHHQMLQTLPTLLTRQLMARKTQLAAFVDIEAEVLETATEQDWQKWGKLFETEMAPTLSQLLILHFRGDEWRQDETAMKRLLTEAMMSAVSNFMLPEQRTVLMERLLQSSHYKKIEQLLHRYLADDTPDADFTVSLR